jgi:hypothetical protein
MIHKSLYFLIFRDDDFAVLTAAGYAKGNTNTLYIRTNVWVYSHRVSNHKDIYIYIYIYIYIHI